jgi:2-oxoglutarate-Fe(II)-dependent dioxygenase family protein
MYPLALTGEWCLRSDAEIAALEDTYANRADFEHLLEEDSIVIAPSGVGPELVVARLVTGCISPRRETIEAFRTVKGEASNRFGPRLPRERPDGTFGLTNDVPKSVRVPGETNYLGWVDATPREPFCRPTAWALEHPDILEMSRDYERDVNQIYREELPHYWQEQMDYMKAVSEQFKYLCSPYSTITVNRNVRSPYHYDKNDFRGGMGNLVVLDGGGDDSGIIVMPRERVAFRVRGPRFKRDGKGRETIEPGDVLFMNVHALHGNLALTPGKERLTTVLYAREKLHKCS